MQKLKVLLVILITAHAGIRLVALASVMHLQVQTLTKSTYLHKAYVAACLAVH